MKTEGSSQLSSPINSHFVLPLNAALPLIERPQLIFNLYSVGFLDFRDILSKQFFIYFDQVNSYFKMVRYDKKKLFSTETYVSSKLSF